MRGRRAFIYAALALAVPLPALALSGDSSDEAGEPNLVVSAALDSCGTAADAIVCKIDASWNQIPGATRYSASVTRPDGSVVDFGDAGAGSDSFWVPYVGNGTYTVSISAYGTPPGETRAKALARGSSSAGGDASGSDAFSTEQVPGPDGAPVDGGEATDPGTPGPDPAPEEPTCEEPPEEPPVPEEPPAAAEPRAPETAEALSSQASAELPETAELPEAVDCPPEEEPVPPTEG